MFKQLRYVYTRGGGGRSGQPPDQLLIYYILCDSSFQPKEGGAFYCKYVICMFKTGPVRIYVLNYIKEHYREHSCSVLGTKKKARDVCLVLEERNTRERG
jgi:hypothetical protein